ncbi:MAG: glutamyl-tRNA reductase, partial [Deltaproteobacteria bacterium]
VVLGTLIGAGEMGELAARHFISSGIRSMMIANRTFERAEKLAEELDGRAVDFNDLLEHLQKADIVLSSTGAPQQIIKSADVAGVIRRRKMKPMFFIDIAVPRDIDPKVNDLENIYLYNTDDLQGVVASNLRQRATEAEKAEEIVNQEIIPFSAWLSSLTVTPTIVALRSRFEEIRRAELAKTLAVWKDLPKEDEKRLEALTAAIIGKLLHPPVSLLKQNQQGNRNDLYVDALRLLFDLNPALHDTDEEPELDE